ncbi:MAG: hypothetical protein M3280_09240 [Actinomycetota bacterium]|nr:hypothetical protein [Actinomycetota bacterium]
MAVFQCPVCELKFTFATELEEHIASSHPDFRADYESPEDEFRAARERRKRQNES